MGKEKIDFDRISRILEENSLGLQLAQILEFFGPEIEERTLLRRLNKMIKLGLITKIGKTKGAIYRILSTEKNPINSSNNLLLSSISNEIFELVNRPENQKSPVGYKVEFLESYIPNKTNYLTTKEKDFLHQLGQTPRLNEPAGTYAKDILQRLLIDLSWNSSRLEGSTYSLLDTQRLISIGESADEKSAKDAQMILNHKDAIEFIVNNSEYVGFNRFTILNIHALLSNNLLPDPASSGKLRSFSVGINKSVYIPLGIPQIIEEMFDKILSTLNLIEDPFEQAFFTMVHLPYLQPFEDVNKRVSRIAANISLNKSNLVPISFIDVPNTQYINGILAIYELNRIELLKEVFIWAYERSSNRYSALRQSLGEPDLFKLKFRDEIKAIIFEIVSNNLNYKSTSKFIITKSEEIDSNLQSQFIESIETELLSLHFGNIARYQINPLQFEKWKEGWYK